MKKMYIIRLIGCDAETEFRAELDEKEYEFLEKIALFSKKISAYACMPTMEIKTEKEWNKQWENYAYPEEVKIEDFPLFIADKQE